MWLCKEAVGDKPEGFEFVNNLLRAIHERRKRDITSDVLQADFFGSESPGPDTIMTAILNIIQKSFDETCEVSSTCSHARRPQLPSVTSRHLLLTAPAPDRSGPRPCSITSPNSCDR